MDPFRFASGLKSRLPNDLIDRSDADLREEQGRHLSPFILAESMARMSQKQLDPIGEAIQTAIESACVIRVSSPSQGMQWTGSGFLIPNGIIVTTAHLFPGTPGSKIEVSFDGVKYFNAMLAGSDESVDVAILMTDSDLPIRPVEFTIDPVIPGEIISVIGAPEGWENTVTVGRVSGTGKTPDEPPDPSWQEMTFVDADISEGSSGSMVIDITGGVIGMAMGVIGERAADYGLGQNAVIPTERILQVMNSKPLTRERL